jgi:hypothetical protein
MLSCLRTGDEQSAHLCLERLTERFGAENERLMALRGLFQEAIAQDDAELKQVLAEYDNILTKDPGNMVGGHRLLGWALLIFLSPSQNGVSHSSSPSIRSPRLSRPSISSSTRLLLMQKLGQSWRIYMSHKGCISKEFLPWKRFC